VRDFPPLTRLVVSRFRLHRPSIFFTLSRSLVSCCYNPSSLWPLSTPTPSLDHSRPTFSPHTRRPPFVLTLRFRKFLPFLDGCCVHFFPLLCRNFGFYVPYHHPSSHQILVGFFPANRREVARRFGRDALAKFVVRWGGVRKTPLWLGRPPSFCICPRPPPPSPFLSERIMPRRGERSFLAALDSPSPQSSS